MLRRLGLVGALVLAGMAPARAAEVPAAPRGRIVERTFSNDAGTRRYLLYVPSAGRQADR